MYGYDDAPHGHAEVTFDDVRVGPDALLLGAGRGFEIAQGRLGPGRLHHCMRAVGLGGRAVELAVDRAAARLVFGKPLSEQGAFRCGMGGREEDEGSSRKQKALLARFAWHLRAGIMRRCVVAHFVGTLRYRRDSSCRRGPSLP